MGNITMDLVEESTTIPPSFVLNIYKDGTNGEHWQEPDSRFTRIQHAGITIPIEVAPSIIQFLQDKVDLHNKKGK